MGALMEIVFGEPKLSRTGDVKREFSGKIHIDEGSLMSEIREKMCNQMELHPGWMRIESSVEVAPVYEGDSLLHWSVNGYVIDQRVTPIEKLAESVIKQDCTCTTQDLMIQGCKCGAMG